MNKKNISETFFAELLNVYKETTGHKLPEVKIYTTGQELYKQGQIPRGIYYIKKGAVRISIEGVTKEVTIRLAKAHDFVGYLSLLKHWDYTSTAIAIKPSEIYFIPKQIFLKSVQTNIVFANYILDIVCSEINESEMMVNDLLVKNVQERLAVLLLSLDHKLTNDIDNIDGQLKVLKKDLAAILNVKAETLSRNLALLEKQKTIKLHAKTNTIEILSRERLLKLSQIKD